METEKNKNHQSFQELSEKFKNATRDLERLADDHAKVINEVDQLKKLLKEVEFDRDNIQKKLTRQVNILKI